MAILYWKFAVDAEWAGKLLSPMEPDVRERVFALSQSVVQRNEVHYSGHVQGVGFRYTVRRIAGRYDVSGFVRNLADGRVQLVVEGPTAQLAEMLVDVTEAMGRNIRNADTRRCSATGEFNSFDIAF